MNITLYKVLNCDGKPIYGGKGSYPLPTIDKPGEWMPPIKPVPCHSGYHLCRGAEHLVHWLGPVIWGVEARGEIVEDDNKVVCESVRLVARVETWNEKTARLFVADCAEHVLPIFENARLGDMRPREAVEAARAYARGEINKVALAAAAAAAWAAVDAAAAAQAAAGAVARAAAWVAADAARAAAWAAADAAISPDTAPPEAARAVARAADATARAADATARAAEQEWQAERLRQYLSGKIK